MNKEDENLWKNFISGNHKAFEQLMLLHYKAMYNYGKKFSTDTEFVKDCIQEVFMNLWQYRQNLSAEIDTPRFYLFKSLKQKILKDLHKDKWLKLTQDLPEDYIFEVEFTIENLLIENETITQNSEQIKKLVATLTKRQREAIYLRFYQDLEYDQIAEIMGVNNHSVVNLIYSAIKFLRTNWMISLLILPFIGICKNIFRS